LRGVRPLANLSAASAVRIDAFVRSGRLHLIPRASRRPRLRPREADDDGDSMSDENLPYFEAFPGWLRALPDDASALAALLASESTPPAARRAIAGALNYLFKSLDLVPDGIDDIGYLDDAFVLRESARIALEDPGAKAADASGTLGRLAKDSPLIAAFLEEDHQRLVAYVRDLQKGAARGRAVDDILTQESVRRELIADVHDFAKGYSVPSFTRDQKTLMKLKSFLSARLPQV
jgi:uncharacterized membrane protein YkvA (DUF1232 family)